MSTVSGAALRAALWQRWEARLHRAGGPVWSVALWLLLAAALLLRLPSAEERLAVGHVSPVDVRAPQRLLYTSMLRTERERAQAAAAQEVIYLPPDREQAIQQRGTAEAIARFLDAVRADPYADEAARSASVAALEDVEFATAEVRTILSLPEEQWRAVVDETLRLVDSQMRAEVHESRLPLILRNLTTQISPALREEQVGVVSRWVSALIVPNTVVDAERTAQARRAARDRIAPVQVRYEAGQIVVREGEIVTSEQVEALAEMGLQQPTRSAWEPVGVALFLALGVGVLALYLARLYPTHFHNARTMAFLAVLMVGLVLMMRAMMPNHGLLRFLVPTAAGAMLLGVLISVDVALLVTVLLALLAGQISGSAELSSYTFVGGVVAVLVLWRVERLGAFVWTGLLVGLANVGVVVAFALQDGVVDWVALPSVSGVAFLNGAASASLALGGFYVLSNVLGMTTFLQLMELARPTHPLFRDLLLKAPGTYNHSIIVSNLAESAAQAVGADMLLVRVAAYYHDVGKVPNPHYFVENQPAGVNLHAVLDDPYRSAEIILSHVTAGIQLAQRHHLPPLLRNMIAQHHGTTLVAYFYHQACEQYGAANVDAERFRYAGPKPQTREAAILMLSDAVEATVRAVKPTDGPELDALVRKSIAARLEEGQLDECELNLRDLEGIRRAFVNILQGIYHPRIAYPDVRPAPAVSLSTPTPIPLLETATHERLDPPPAPDQPALGSPS